MPEYDRLGYEVAPRVGAWIETVDREKKLTPSVSHPVWVRGLKQAKRSQRTEYGDVAPRVGAWIETSLLGNFFTPVGSHPVWVRGLKRI